MLSVVLIVLVGTVITVVPGAVLGWRLQLPIPIALVCGPALTFGMIGLVTLPLGAIPIAWNLITAVTVFAAFLLLAQGWRVYAGRRGWGSRHIGFVSRTHIPLRLMVLPAMGVALGAVTILVTSLRRLVNVIPGGINNVPQGWDALWHTNTVQFIYDSGVASPRMMGDLINTDTHAAHFYPTAWHALAALVMPVSDATSLQTFNVYSIVSLALTVPSGIAVLAWSVVRPRVSVSAAALISGLAAAVGALLPALPYVELGVYATPSAVAVAVGLLAAGLVMSAVREYSRIPAAILAVVGVASLQPSGAFVCAVIVLFWWLGHQLRHPAQGRLADFYILASIGGVSLALLIPQILGVFIGEDEIGAFTFFESTNRAVSWEKVLTLHTRHLEDVATPWIVLFFSLMGLLALIRMRQWWLVGLWSFLALCTVNAVQKFDIGLPNFMQSDSYHSLGDVFLAVTSLFYNDPRRLSYVLSMLVAVAAGIGLAMVVVTTSRWFTRRRSGRTVVIENLIFRIGTVAISVGIVVIAYFNYNDNSSLATMGRDDRLVSPSDIQAFAWLSQQPGAYDGLVLNNLDQGTGWMYALEGLHPTFTHYRAPGFSDDLLALYWHIKDAGKDPNVDRALEKLNVRYVMDSPPSYWFFQPNPGPLFDLVQTPGLRLVKQFGEARIFEVKATAERQDAKPVQ
ncbi:MAG: DUF6541 family protein [Mycobacteriaceae bacterium]